MGHLVDGQDVLGPDGFTPSQPVGVHACSTASCSHVRAFRVSFGRKPSPADWFACESIAVDVKENRNEGASSDSFGAYAAAEVGCSSSNLVDPASSHMLVSKVKPCMS